MDGNGISNVETKQCFTCKEDLPLEKFKKVEEGVYSIPSAKGVLVNCRRCNAINELKQGAVRRVDGKFKVMDWTDEEIVIDNMRR